MSKKHGKVLHFSGARIEDISQYIIPIIKKHPNYLIRHGGTNDATTNTSKKFADDWLILKSNISQQFQVAEYCRKRSFDMMVEIRT